MENKTPKSTNNLADFFNDTAPSFRPLKLLGWQFYELENATITKLYEAATSASGSDNSGGIVPAIYSFEPHLKDQLKNMQFPVVAECEVVSIAGAKNKSTNHVVSIKQ